jgi:hypothetical protein
MIEYLKYIFLGIYLLYIYIYPQFKYDKELVLLIISSLYFWDCIIVTKEENIYNQKRELEKQKNKNEDLEKKLIKINNNNLKRKLEKQKKINEELEKKLKEKKLKDQELSKKKFYADDEKLGQRYNPVQLIIEEYFELIELNNTGKYFIKAPLFPGDTFPIKLKEEELELSRLTEDQYNSSLELSRLKEHQYNNYIKSVTKEKKDNRKDNWFQKYKDHNYFEIKDFKFQKEDGDCSCMFHTFKRILKYSKNINKETDQLRKEAVEYNCNRWEDYKSFFPDFKSSDEYKNFMMKKEEFGTHLELNALCEIYKINIYILDLNNDPEHPKLAIVPDKPEFKHKGYCYYHGTHYDSLVPV